MSTDSLDRTAERRRRHAAIRAEVAEEEDQAGELEAADAAAALDVALHLRIDRGLDQVLRARAREEHVPMSALGRVWWMAAGVVVVGDVRAGPA